MNINSISCVSQNFMGLPQHLQKTKIMDTDYKGMTEIIRDAGIKAGVVIKTSPAQVKAKNKGLFDKNGRVVLSPDTKDLINFYSRYSDKSLTSCTNLRDALANCYKERLAEGDSPKYFDALV